MNKIKQPHQRSQTAHFQRSNSETRGRSPNPYQEKISLIGSMRVIHPLLDRLIEVKMTKCLQHGHAYHSNRISEERTKYNPQFYKTIEAPTISGSMKTI